RRDRHRRPGRPDIAPGRRVAAHRAAFRAAGLGRPPVSRPHAAALAHGVRAEGIARCRCERDTDVVPGVARAAGTRPVTAPIPNAVPFLGGNEWKYVKECLDTNWVSSVGPFVDRFEREVAEYVGAPHAIATVNGTAALHVALLGAGVHPGDEVLVPTLTFIATANAIRYCGAVPLFVDCDPVSWGMDAAKVAGLL